MFNFNFSFNWGRPMMPWQNQQNGCWSSPFQNFMPWCRPQNPGIRMDDAQTFFQEANKWGHGCNDGKLSREEIGDYLSTLEDQLYGDSIDLSREERTKYRNLIRSGNFIDDNYEAFEDLHNHNNAITLDDLYEMADMDGNQRYLSQRDIRNANDDDWSGGRWRWWGW